MPKAYRKIHQWNHWLSHALGKDLLDIEKDFLQSLVSLNGKHALLIGVPQQHSLLTANRLRHHLLLSPIINKKKELTHIESDFYDLPILSASIDLVIVPHTLEFLDNPQQLLIEACRIVKPEGHIVLLGFNPYGIWGLKKIMMKHKEVPWNGNFISALTVKKWLALADFELMNHQAFLFRPPVEHPLFQQLHFLEYIGKCFSPLGAVYALVAKAKVIPLTPVRLQWKQTLSQVSSIAQPIPRPTTRSI